MPLFSSMRGLRFQEGCKCRNIDRARAAAKRMNLQKTSGFRNGLCWQAEPGQRVFEQRDDRHGIAGKKRRLDQQLQQCALRCGVQRRAGAVVCLDPETFEFGHDPARKAPVRCDQRHLTVL